MGPAGNSPSNFPIHGALGAWRARAGPVQRPGGPGPEAGDPMRSARQGLRDSEFRLSRGGPRAQARRNRTGHEQGLMQDTRRCQGPPSFKTRVTCFPAAWSHVSPDRPKVCHAPPQGLIVLWGETFGNLTPTNVLCVLQQVGLQQPSLLRIMSTLQLMRSSTKAAGRAEVAWVLTDLEVPDALGRWALTELRRRMPRPHSFQAPWVQYGFENAEG